MHQAYVLGIHNCYGKMKETAKKYGTARANISTVMNKGVKMLYKVTTTKIFTFLAVIVELSTYVSKPKGSLE